MTGRLRTVFLVGLVVVIINLPFVHSRWQDHRIASDGTDVTATVTDTDEAGGSHFVTFRVEESTPSRASAAPSRSSRPAMQEVVETGEIEVKVLPGSTSVWRVEGEARSGVGLVITLVADVCLLVLVVLLMRFGSRAGLLDPGAGGDRGPRAVPAGSVLDRAHGAAVRGLRGGRGDRGRRGGARPR